MQISYPVLYSYFLKRHLEGGGGEVPSSREIEVLKEQKQISHFDVLVKTEKLQILFDQSYPAIFVSLVACALLSAILWPVQNNELLIPWILTLVTSALVRFVLFMFYNRLQPQGKDLLAWEWPYFITLFMSSAAWGIGALYILPIDSQLHQLVIYFFLMGITGGAISVYSANRPMTMASIAIVILPMTAWFIIQGTLLAVGIALSSILFSIAAMRTGKILSVTLNQSFKLAHELKSAKENAERIANIDELSGLNNRRAFYENGKILVDYCLRNNEQLSVIIFDIDHFKQINDKLGHAAGDATIEHIGQILQSTIRKSDLCARIGGEEFAILLKPSVLDEAAQLAEILRQLINKTPIAFQDEDFFISASFGVAVGISDLDSLLKRADSAMYKAKEKGRNIVICDNEMPSPMSGGHLNEK